MQDISYFFTSGRRSILADIYFPLRIATQGTIYTALEEGLRIDVVRTYLRKNAVNIKRELAAYPHWFDPNRYGDTRAYRSEHRAAEARMDMWSQVFFGWSLDEVKGVFLKKDGKTIDEETTQLIKLMFKFENSRMENHALCAGYPDVYRAILYWVLSQYGQADDYRHWNVEERRLFVERHSSWSSEKRAYADDAFIRIARRIAKWIDDCGLFIFGYLVRLFWQKIVELHQKRHTSLEDEIWVTSIFHIDINVLRPTKRIV